MKLSKLKYGKNNPRKISAEALEQLKKSITDFPGMLELRPLIFDPVTFEVLGGNQRLKALKELGYTEVPEMWVKSADNLTEEEKKRFVLYGWYEGEAHNWYSDRKQTTILEFDRPQRNGEHPTMKPIKLIEYLINNSSKTNDLIGDGFLGSGTTMVAAHQLNRKCYGMELDPKYCQVIIERMIKLDNTLTVKINGKQYHPY